MNGSVFSVVVVGAGHAGVEAALFAARAGESTALVTMCATNIARMSCNPSIGGISKSNLVFEIDALGGEMGRNADYTGIQFRTLNTKKGPAVQAVRAQCDKRSYPARIQSVIKETKNLSVLEGLVLGLAFSNKKLWKIQISTGTSICAKVVIFTVGTFLQGLIHIGDRHFSAGRFGESAAIGLSEILKGLGFKFGRLKTGTPPRLHRDSIDYEKMILQPGDIPPPFFSRQVKKMFHVEHSNKKTKLAKCNAPWVPGSHQLPCFLTHTTRKTHEIIAKNLGKSALYGGAIVGTGVRYCPSIEDKVVKFSDRDAHHVFIEPEGRDNVSIYPNGTSNSLPEDVQVEMVRSIPGLERARFIRPGYAIEYDFLYPTQLQHTLESREIENLYFAGQINGTTGYEEAAAQGLMAGINAVLKLRNEKPLIIGRHEAYIGVLIDDLVTKGVDEPYRMFTSRAEYRLVLRQESAVYRLMPYVRSLGVLSEEELCFRERECQMLKAEICRLERACSEGESLSHVLSRPGSSYQSLVDTNPMILETLVKEIETNVKYEGYLNRELLQIEKHRKMECLRIPEFIDYEEIKSLRYEAREKLKKIRPLTVGQASRIPGVNPADISVLLLWISRQKLCST